MKNVDRRRFMGQASTVAVTVAVPSWLWGCSGSAQVQASAPEAAPPAPAETPVPPPPPPGDGPSPSEWDAQVHELEGTGVLTAEAEGKWTGKAGSHVPKVTFEPGTGAVTIETPHGMSEEHYITAHYVKNPSGTVLAFQSFSGKDQKALSTHTLPDGTSEITVFSHCNKHDTWSAVPAAPAVSAG